MAQITLDDEQILLLWHLTERAGCQNGQAADLLAGLRAQVRPHLAKANAAMKAAEDALAEDAPTGG